METKTAAFVAIGNELLSGEIVDRNAEFLIPLLRELGLALEAVFTLPDDLGVLEYFLRIISPKYDYVFTSGGVGPTHDDVTMEAIARALDRKLVVNREITEAIRHHYGDRTNEYILKMGYLPEGAEMIRGAGLTIPVVRVENIYIFPGDPGIFRRKILAIKERFRSSPFYQRAIYIRLDEGEIAGLLRGAEEGHRGVSVGSYPRYDESDYRVRIKLESKDEHLLEEAYQYILARLPGDAVVKKS